MEAEENSEMCSNNDFLLLLAKKRKLIDLREDLLSRRQQRQIDEGNMSSDNADSPVSLVTQASITPPPFSPLTPLMTKAINNQGRKEFCDSNPETPLSHILKDISVSGPIPNIEEEPLSSPIPPMSPETQKLFNVLTETDLIYESNASDVIENSDISDQDGNCDDSVADPDFDINLENESETDCESYDEDEDGTKNEKNNRGEEKCSGGEQTKAMTLLVKKNRPGKISRNEVEHKSVEQINDEHKTPESLPKKSTRCEDNDNGTVTNLEVLEILACTPEKEIKNNKEYRIITSPKDEKETLRSTPKKRPRNEDNVSLTPKNKEIMDILKFTPEKETRNDKGHKSNIPPNDEHGTLKKTPKRSIGYEEKNSPVLNIECLDILTSTPEKENNNLIPTIQILEIGTMSPENVVETNTIGNSDLVTSTSELNAGRPKKGRKRKHPQTNSERKFNKYNNLQYTTLHKQKEIQPKAFVAFKCKCLKQCYNLISEQTRKEEFEKFVKLGSYNAQLMYIASCVKEEKKKRSYTMTSVPANKKKPKQFHRTYTLRGVKVCRDMFLKTLQITTQKVTITLMKVRNNSLNDSRGSTIGGWNKLTEDHFNFIVEVITKLPKYESHYRREKSNEALYLEPGMTLSKIYEIYQKMFAEKFGNEEKCASFGCVKKIFLTKFNLRCKGLKKDTCNKCDFFAIQLQNAKGSTEKERIEADKSTHLEKAEAMRNQMKRDFKNAQENENIECLSFDLEKTLPLPRIPTNVVFYKRQLWFYNSGIHSASDDVGHCYVWVEGEAGRGAQEVGSCLIKYIETKLRPTAEHLILWSDCCGGQNRNVKIVVMLKVILNSHPTLKKISFRYLESGHTFLPNDTDFSKIETALKKQQRVYTAEEYINIIQKAKKRNPFQVYKMKKTDFYSTEMIEKKITNRKKFTDKTKVNWLQAKEIMIEKEKPYSIFMRPSFEENFMELNIQKNSKGGHFVIDKSDFTPLWPNGKSIAPAKLADLQSLFKYIPEDCVQFYKQLTASEDVIDDVDGFGGEIDFIPDIED